MALSALAKTTKQDMKVLNVAYRGYQDGSVEFFGDQIQLLTGYTKEDFNSKNVKWTDLILHEDQDHARRVFIQALKTEKTYMREYRINLKTGEIRWMQEWGQIVCNEKGEMEYVLGILADITRNKQLEEARLKSEQRTGKYLNFDLASGEYSITLQKVREIIGMMPVTSVPEVPEFVKGVINLRGKVIPVVDLRLRFGLEPTDYNERTCIIIVEINGETGQLLVGIVVDSVREVLHLNGEDIEDTPEFGANLDTDYILGMAKGEGQVKILLDIDRVLGSGEITSLGNVA